jgi:hypothetical protein
VLTFKKGIIIGYIILLNKQVSIRFTKGGLQSVGKAKLNTDICINIGIGG